MGTSGAEGKKAKERSRRKEGVEKWAALMTRAVVKLVLGTELRLYFKVSLVGILMHIDPSSDAVQPAVLAVLLSFVNAGQIIYAARSIIPESDTPKVKRWS